MPSKKRVATLAGLERAVPKFNTNLVPDIDAGRISNIPRSLVGEKQQTDKTATLPFYFGGSNVRAYYKVA